MNLRSVAFVVSAGCRIDDHLGEPSGLFRTGRSRLLEGPCQDGHDHPLRGSRHRRLLLHPGERGPSRTALARQPPQQEPAERPVLTRSVQATVRGRMTCRVGNSKLTLDTRSKSLGRVAAPGRPRSRQRARIPWRESPYRGSTCCRSRCFRRPARSVEPEAAFVRHDCSVEMEGLSRRTPTA